MDELAEARDNFLANYQKQYLNDISIFKKEFDENGEITVIIQYLHKIIENLNKLRVNQVSK